MPAGSEAVHASTTQVVDPGAFGPALSSEARCLAHAARVGRLSRVFLERRIPPQTPRPVNARESPLDSRQMRSALGLAEPYHRGCSPPHVLGNVLPHPSSTPTSCLATAFSASSICSVDLVPVSSVINGSS